MHSLFTPVDTLDGSNFLRAVHSADGTLTVEKEEKLTTDTTNPAIFQTFNNEPAGTSVNTVTGGQSEISLQDGETILLPRVPSLALHDHGLRFIHS